MRLATRSASLLTPRASREATRSSISPSICCRRSVAAVNSGKARPGYTLERFQRGGVIAGIGSSFQKNDRRFGMSILRTSAGVGALLLESGRCVSLGEDNLLHADIMSVVARPGLIQLNTA